MYVILLYYSIFSAEQPMFTNLKHNILLSLLVLILVVNKHLCMINYIIFINYFLRCWSLHELWNFEFNIFFILIILKMDWEKRCFLPTGKGYSYLPNDGVMALNRDWNWREIFVNRSWFGHISDENAFYCIS